jgi:hypothetical protein
VARQSTDETRVQNVTGQNVTGWIETLAKEFEAAAPTRCWRLTA